MACDVHLDPTALVRFSPVVHLKDTRSNKMPYYDDYSSGTLEIALVRWSAVSTPQAQRPGGGLINETKPSRVTSTTVRQTDGTHARCALRRRLKGKDREPQKLWRGASPCLARGSEARVASEVQS